MSTAVTWWLGRGPSPQEFRDLFVDPFNAAQSSIRLDLRVLESAAREQTVAALENGTGPDIVMVPRAGDFLALAARGRFLDLTPYAERFGWVSRLLPPALRLAARDCALFGLPRSSETMMLTYNRRVLDDLGHRPPATAAELESVAARALRQGLLPFGAGCADMPESSELLWTLVVNHYAGPAAVRAALRGEIPWTDRLFVESLERLTGWFQNGWFGDHYFTDTIDEGLARVVAGSAAMAPGMTGMMPDDPAAVDAVPFPSLRDEVPTPLYVFGTASLIGINAASQVPGEAATVLDRLFTNEVRRLFSEHVPGDWNIPLSDPDADALTRVAPAVFARPAIGLTEAIAAGRHGYADWSYLPPETEALITAHVRPLVEGSLRPADHLAQLQSVFTRESFNTPLPGLE